MKKQLLLIILLMISASIYAQENKIKHFEVGVSAMFWTPSSQHLKSSSIYTEIFPEHGGSYSYGSLQGYGGSIAPGFTVKYYFKNNIGVAFSFDMIHMDNELDIKESDTTFENFENEADIPSFSLGLSGRTNLSDAFQLHYETGFRFISGYMFEMHYNTNGATIPDLKAEDVVFGIYLRFGVDFRIYKSLYLNSTLEYSYLPASLDYSNYNGSTRQYVETNIGGIGLLTGLIYKF